MPVEQKREGNVCEKCKKSNTEVGPITEYKDPHSTYKGLLCSDCIEMREKPYTERCPVCKELAYKKGGLTFFDESDLDSKDDVVTYDEKDFDNFYNFDHDEKSPLSAELMCLECHEKKVERERKIRKIKLKIKNFVKDHWKFWVTIIIAIIGLIIGIPRL